MVKLHGNLPSSYLKFRRTIVFMYSLCSMKNVDMTIPTPATMYEDMSAFRLG